MSLDVAAVILAAGQSQRMGGVNKLLAEWRGKILVQHIVDAALQSKAKNVLVVTGYQAAEVKQALQGHRLRFVDNEDFAQGLSTSLKAGLAALDPDVSGAAILLADMPELKTETLDVLIETFQQKKGEAITVPVCGGRRGNPVIWPKTLIPEILKLNGDKGARNLMNNFPDRVEEVMIEDTGVLMDVDTSKDF